MRCSLPVLTAVLLGLGVPPAGPTTTADASSAAVISRVETPQQQDVAQHAIDAAMLRNVGIISAPAPPDRLRHPLPKPLGGRSSRRAIAWCASIRPLQTARCRS